MMAALTFFVGMFCGAAVMVIIFVTAVLRMHRVDRQAESTRSSVMPVIIPETNSMH
jgi:hypothetical protein